MVKFAFLISLIVHQRLSGMKVELNLNLFLFLTNLFVHQRLSGVKVEKFSFVIAKQVENAKLPPEHRKKRPIKPQAISSSGTYTTR